MLKKAWSLIALIIVAVIIIDIAVLAVEPYLPIIGIGVAIIILIAIGRVVLSRRR